MATWTRTWRKNCRERGCFGCVGCYENQRAFVPWRRSRLRVPAWLVLRLMDSLFSPVHSLAGFGSTRTRGLKNLHNFKLLESWYKYISLTNVDGDNPSWKSCSTLDIHHCYGQSDYEGKTKSALVAFSPTSPSESSPSPFSLQLFCSFRLLPALD